MNIPDKIIQYAGNPINWEKSHRNGQRGELYYIPTRDAWLKINASGLSRYVEVLRFLEGKVNCPRVISYVKDENRQFLLMTNISGKPLYHQEFITKPDTLVRILADSLRSLHRLDINDCQIIVTAKKTVPHRTNNIKDQLWLINNIPTHEDLVFTHGDACLQNILSDGNSFGFVDLGDGGIGDRWKDLSLALWSLQFHLKTRRYGKHLLERYGISVNFAKLKFYLRYYNKI